MAVLGCQPVRLFPAWSCQWKSCWKNSRKELSFLHSIDQVNTLPRVSLKRLLWCFKVEKCILNVKSCLVIFKTDHENAQQKAHWGERPCGAARSCARIEQGWEHHRSIPSPAPCPCSSQCWISTKGSKETNCPLIFAQQTVLFAPALLMNPPKNSAHWRDLDQRIIQCLNHVRVSGCCHFLPKYLKEKFACFKTRLGGRGIRLQLCSACS